MNNQNDYQITTQMELINPDIAKLYLQTNTMNRKINENIVLRYANDMINDNWSITSQTISFANDGTLIDGQHRLKAIIKANKSIWFNVSRNVPKDSFINYDKNKVRSIGDVFDISKIPNSKQVAAGIQFYDWILKDKLYIIYSVNKISNSETNRPAINQRLSNNELLEFYNNNSNYLQELSTIAQRIYKPLKFFPPSHYIGFIYYLNHNCLYDLNFVISFFEQLSTNENVTNKSITNLREVYIANAVNQKKKMNPALKLIYLIKCWNAYCNGIEIKKYMFSENEDLPKFQINNNKIES